VDKTCNTCAYHTRKTITVDSGIFWKKTKTKEVDYCSRFGAEPTPTRFARGYFDWSETPVCFAEGPCGAEGKFWEPIDSSEDNRGGDRLAEAMADAAFALAPTHPPRREL
jgi:hypothetical protein